MMGFGGAALLWLIGIPLPIIFLLAIYAPLISGASGSDKSDVRLFINGPEGNLRTIFTSGVVRQAGNGCAQGTKIMIIEMVLLLVFVVVVGNSTNGVRMFSTDGTSGGAIPKVASQLTLR